MSIVVNFEGRWIDPYQPHDSEHDEMWRKAVTEGVLYGHDGEPMTEKGAKRFRADYFGTYAARNRPMFDPSAITPARPYIPGLMNHGTVPMFGGPPKVGKSTTVLDFAASLIIPGRRFMDHFAPAEMTYDESHRSVWYINAENPMGDVHQVLQDFGLTYDRSEQWYYHPESERVLFVDHLSDLGGADVFDMSDTEARDFWEYRIEGINEGPLTVIADGVTAMLNADTSRYGAWYAGFRKLLAAIDAPNGLAVGHNGLKTGHLMGAVESMAGPDALWKLDAHEPDSYPDAPRYFQVTPRLLGPKVPGTRVILLEGRPVIHESPAAAPKPSAQTQAHEREARAEHMRELLREAEAPGLFTTDLTGRGEDGRENKQVLEYMRDELHEIVSVQVQEGRIRGTRWWWAVPRTSDPPLTGDSPPTPATLVTPVTGGS